MKLKVHLVHQKLAEHFAQHIVCCIFLHHSMCCVETFFRFISQAENPGVVLFVEVGYKYKFFGDDAEVCAVFCI